MADPLDDLQTAVGLWCKTAFLPGAGNSTPLAYSEGFSLVEVTRERFGVLRARMEESCG